MLYSGCILHTVVVGFHHRRGAIVELAFPPFISSEASLSSDDHCNPPHKWRNLASLALPDGAHNYLKDVVYFTLPSLEKDQFAVFGVASYRQADSVTLSHPAPEVTRNTVQKSLVVLSRFPLFSFIAHHLSHLAETLFENGGFDLERLQKVYTELGEKFDAVLASPMLYQDALHFNLSAANFVRVYGRDSLVLFKLLLLERRVLFVGESAGWISNWLVTLLSLMPDLLSGGLYECCFVDREWLSEKACWPTLCGTPTATVQVPFDSYLEPSNFFTQATSRVNTNVESDLCHSAVAAPDNEELSEVRRSQPSDPTPKPSVLNRDDASKNHPVNPSEALVPGDLQRACSNQPLLTKSTPHANGHESDRSNDSYSPFSPFPTDHWGFPLSLFTKSNILPLYTHLGSLDLLLEPLTCKSPVVAPINGVTVTDRSVRAFLAGATNALLRTHKRLAEVIVTSLSPTDGLPDPDNHPHSSLTALFEKNNQPVLSKSVSADELPISSSTAPGNRSVSRHIGFPKRSSTAVHICTNIPTNNLTGVREPRITPAPLAQALQLTRIDRAFIDELQKVVTLWYQARTALQSACNVSPLCDLADFLDDNLLEEYMGKLSPTHRTILLQFPSNAILDAYVRQHFLSYLRGLLLTAEGYGNSVSDFNSLFVNCLRSTRSFLIWRGQLIPDKIFLVSNPSVVSSSASVNMSDTERCSIESQAFVEENPHSLLLSDFPILSNDPSKTISSNLADASSQPPVVSSAYAVAALFAQHPGRRCAEADDWEQFVGGFKKFRDLAADRGRRIVNQGVQGWSKFSSDLNTSFRSGASSTVISRFSDAFKSLLGPSPTTGR
ncbi:hypothetical protein EG68_08079 [Paragonimus skrjabini miyazakii]|uniref:UDENN domain-containing protein n=1 Tax=Paragonimus skrjabini miyazakii TaxID=59628 RepID=A0A8S9YD94_9TREM|nr:hypothetical protein EG68_08079 [Paragonimus skrjabini miyazakii]